MEELDERGDDGESFASTFLLLIRHKELFACLPLPLLSTWHARVLPRQLHTEGEEKGCSKR